MKTRRRYTYNFEARRLIEQNGISVNQNKVKSIYEMITMDNLKKYFIIIKKGKKHF